MNFSPGSGVFVKLSRLFFEFHIWVMLRMYLNGKVSTSLCKLPPGVRLKKVNDTEVGPDYATKFSRQFLFLWLVALVVTACIWYSFNLGCVVTTRNEENSEYCEEQRFNVSKNQLHAFASLFSNSDQMISLECVRVPGPEKQISNSIACSLKSLCLEKQKFEHEHHWLADTTELRNQCSVRDEIDWKHSSSFLHEDSLSVSQPPDLSTSSEKQNCGQNSLQTMRDVSTKHQCGNSPCCLLKGCWWFLVIVILSWKVSGGRLNLLRCKKHEPDQLPPAANQRQLLLPQKQQQEFQKSPKVSGKWRKKLLIIFVLIGVLISIWLFWHLNEKIKLRRKETLASMCDERARMLQDQFNVSMNHVHALAILVSTFHHGKYPSAIDQVTFGKYTERTAFERPLTSGVAYALKVVHSEREEFENRQGWMIKQMGTEDQTLVQDCMPENLSPAPVQDEYAPVIFSQETVSHIVSIDMMSGKEDRENILRARRTGKGVLTSPFKLLKSNHLGVVLTFAVYNVDLPPNATPEQRTEATVGYLGASYDIRSLVDKLLHQLASKQTIVVHVYDTTNTSTPIVMYGNEVQDTGLLRVSSLDFGDPLRKHEMHCRFKQKPPMPWTAINASVGFLVIILLVGHIFHAAISRIAKVENDYREMMELKARAEAADVAKSQFLATVSHEIRTPMNGVLGMLQMLMDTNLDANQMDFAQTAHASGKDLISLINEVLDQAKIESGRLELELVPFDIRSILDNILSLFSGKCNEKGTELAVYVSDQVPEVLVGDPGRVRQIITNLVGNSIKFTDYKGHIFVSVHLVGEAKGTPVDKILQQGSGLMQDMSSRTYNTLSGYPVVERSKSWEKFKLFNSANVSEDPEKINLLVTVEDTGVGIPLDAQSRIFTPFMQADSSTSRTYGGTGIGLSISKHLVELMHGEIGFVSKPDVGSTFSFTGTFGKGEKMPLDPKWQHFDSLVSVFRGFKALVIDSKTIRTEVSRYHLQRLGISVQTTSTLDSACDLLSTTPTSSDVACADVVLIDKEVWNKEAFILYRDLLNRCRQNGETEIFVKLPKVFLLGSSISTMECNYLKSAGMIDNLITKPLRLSVLIACFKEALGGDRRRLLNIKKTSTLGTLLREKQILVVDDNMVNRRVAEGALKKYGAIVTCVNSGKDALKMLKPPHEFDACFMDIQMPEMHGFDATRFIRSAEAEVNQKIASGEASAETYGGISHWHIPILAMTADVIQATNEERAKCGMDDYVTKPFEEAQLYNAVARFFESSG